MPLLAPAVVLLAMSCPPGPAVTCAALPVQHFADWGACADARDAARERSADTIAVCIVRGRGTNEPTE